MAGGFLLYADVKGWFMGWGAADDRGRLSG